MLTSRDTKFEKYNPDPFRELRKSKEAGRDTSFTSGVNQDDLLESTD